MTYQPDHSKLVAALAATLNGREYRSEISELESKQAKDAGLVVVFGYSDDNVEFAGAIHDEIGAWTGREIFVTKDGEVLDTHECDCKHCGYADKLKSAKKITAEWSPESLDASWLIRTEIPHSTFDVMEDGKLFCRGIVFSIKDL